jgi:hypothetical protein
MKSDLIKKIAKWALFTVALIICVKVVHAQSYLGEGWDQYLTGVKTFAPNSRTGEDLAINFVLNAIRIVRNVVGAVALLMGIIYGVKMIFARGEEDALTKQKKNFLFVFIGFIVLIISENVASIFNPETATSQALIDFDAARDQVRDIIDYVKWLLGSIIVLYMVISSVRLISAQGNDEEIKTQKNNITYGFIGILVILLANNIVNAIYIINSPQETAAASPTTAIGEITSLIRLALVFLGPIAIAFTIYAGFYYLSALDNEERVNKAKRMIVAGITAIVIIYAAYALVNTIAQEDLTTTFVPLLA